MTNKEMVYYKKINFLLFRPIGILNYSKMITMLDLKDDLGEGVLTANRCIDLRQIEKYDLDDDDVVVMAGLREFFMPSDSGRKAGILVPDEIYDLTLQKKGILMQIGKEKSEIFTNPKKCADWLGIDETLIEMKND